MEQEGDRRYIQELARIYEKFTGLKAVADDGKFVAFVHAAVNHFGRGKPAPENIGELLMATSIDQLKDKGVV